MYLNFTVKGFEIINKTPYSILTRSERFLKCKFDFVDDTFANKNLKALFWIDNDHVYPSVIVDGECDIPDDALKTKYVRVGICTDGEDVFIQTNMTQVTMTLGVADRVDNPLDPTPTVYQQLKQYIKDTLGKLKPVASSGSYNDLEDTPTSLPASDVFDWAKQAEKPSYSKSDVGLGNVENKSSSTIRSEITAENVTTALQYIPANKTTVDESIRQLNENLVDIGIIYSETLNQSSGNITYDININTEYVLNTISLTESDNVAVFLTNNSGGNKGIANIVLKQKGSFTFNSEDHTNIIFIFNSQSSIKFTLYDKSGKISSIEDGIAEIKNVITNDVMGKTIKTFTKSIAQGGYYDIVYPLKSGKTYYVNVTSWERNSGSQSFLYLNKYVGDYELVSLVSLCEMIVFTPKDNFDFIRIYDDNLTSVTIEYGEVYPKSIDFRLSKIEEKTNKNIQYKILVLGDSYSASGLWTQFMKSGLGNDNTEIVNLAVSGASIKDKYNDRITYPYTSRPRFGVDEGNLNTFACQVEKLKRLMLGVDLDTGEQKIYENENMYPNIIIIEGGMNDYVDSDEKVSSYYSNYIKSVENVWIKDGYSDEVKLGNTYIKTPISEVDRTCFGGAYRYLVEELSTLFPKAQLFFTTTSRLGYWQYDINTIRDNCSEQQRICAKLCGANVIDWNKYGAINTIVNYPKGDGTQSNPYPNVNINSLDTDDAMHPNMFGAMKYGKLAELTISQYYYGIDKYTT